MGFLDNLLAPFSTSSADKASADRIAAAQQGYGQYADLANQARGALTTNYTSALNPWQSLWTGGAQGGAQAYADATGANGIAGLDRARAQFQASPGFDFQLNTGLDALNRASVARGGATGNN